MASGRVPNTVRIRFKLPPLGDVAGYAGGAVATSMIGTLQQFSGDGYRGGLTCGASGTMVRSRAGERFEQLTSNIQRLPDLRPFDFLKRTAALEAVMTSE